MNQYVTSQPGVGMRQLTKPKTVKMVGNQPLKVDPSEIGKIYNRTANEILNMQELPSVRMDQNLFTNESGYRGVLPREPTPFSYIYVRPELDIMSGYQAPTPNARGYKTGPLTDFPVLKQLPYNYGTYQ